jgi:hypothetical protein
MDRVYLRIGVGGNGTRRRSGGSAIDMSCYENMM